MQINFHTRARKAPQLDIGNRKCAGGCGRGEIGDNPEKFCERERRGKKSELPEPGPDSDR